MYPANLQPLKAIKDLRSLHADIKKVFGPTGDDDYVLYRGQSDADWKLESTLHREQSSKIESDVSKYSEASALSSVMREDSFKQISLSIFDIIARMQHYEDRKPTRFLDFSTDFYKALFFACLSERNRDIDGRLFISKYNVYRPNGKDTKIICSLALLDKPTKISAFARNTQLTYYLDFQDPQDVISRFVVYHEHGFAVVPTPEDYISLSTYNKRIQLQEGGFFICTNEILDSNGKLVDNMGGPSSHKFAEDDTYYGAHTILPKLRCIPKTMCDSSINTTSIVIPAKLKNEILCFLEDEMEITECTLGLNK